jgi:energy-coupling factor transporter ATP-binding protein EcfA2
LRRLFRFLAHPRRGLTRAEQREIDAEKVAKAAARSEAAGLKMEAAIFARVLSDKLLGLGVCYEKKKADGTGWGRFRVVKFQQAYVKAEAIYLQVDLRPGKAPPGIGVKDLNNKDILPDLEIAVGHPVKVYYSAERGFWYIVERAAGIRGIPRHVKFDDVLASRPSQSDGLALAMGAGEDRRVVWRSMKKMQSLLIAGSTGAGKSNVLNAMLCTLIKYNDPRRLRLVLVDLKGGVELSPYKALPHIQEVLGPDEDGKPQKIVKRKEDVLPALGWVIREVDRRAALLEAKEVRDIGDYNQHWGPLPHIIVVIDEYADVKTEPKLGAQAEELLINVSNRGRAAGVHVILCTQSPTSEVVSGRVKNAMPAKLVFAMANEHTSQAVLGNRRAHRLTPVGRAIFAWQQSIVELQAPFISTDQVKAMIAQAIAGKWEEAPARKHDVDDAEIYDWALSQEQGGYLVANNIYAAFRGRGMSQQYAEDFCRLAEGKTVMVSSSSYKVMPRSKAHQGRRLLPVEDLPDPEPPALIADAGSLEPDPEPVTALEEIPALEAVPPPDPAGPPTVEEVLAWALANNGGGLQVAAVWQAFKPRGLSNLAARALLAGLDGQTVTVEGRAYRVAPTEKVTGAGQLPRRLVPLDGVRPGVIDGVRAEPAPSHQELPDDVSSRDFSGVTA